MTWKRDVPNRCRHLTISLLAVIGSAWGGVSDASAAESATQAAGRFPASIAGRKILDQHGDVYLMRTFSSWSMAQHLSDADITTALEGVASRGFNAVTVWIGGGYNIGDGWNEYTNQASEPFWTGTPWASSLGDGWSSVDHIVAETARLGLAVNLSFAGGFGDTGAGVEWEAVTDADMYDAGVAIATRYLESPHVVWHVMLDDTHSPSSTRGQRIDSLFRGINDAEGADKRPVRWVEPGNGNSIRGQFLDGDSTFSSFNLTLDGWYNYGSNSVEIAETGYAEGSVPVGDTEPPYDGSPHYAENLGQQLRERSYATFLEGGSYINYGHEDWWPFGAAGLYSEGLSWGEVPDHVHTVEQSYVWALIDEYVADPTWEPSESFVTAGTDEGDTKAAAGASDTAAMAYFPTSRDVVVDTTVAGPGNVRLRWYDPTAGTFITITESEPTQSDRSVPYPDPHADGTSDWVLVVDAAGTDA
jgi:hypothetical protein